MLMYPPCVEPGRAEDKALGFSRESCASAPIPVQRAAPLRIPLTVVSREVKETLDTLRREAGKDIWLYGGGELFRSLFELGCVDTIEPAIIPVMLGSGRPLLPSTSVRRTLSLTEQRVYETSGIVLLKYDVVPEPPG
jgi:hypothetical protein